MGVTRSGSKGVPRPVREAQILDAAAAELSERGYAASSVASVAERADISKPLIYSYFGSKDGLYRACCNRAGTGLTDHIAAALDRPGHSAIGRGLEVLRAIFTALEPRPHDWNVLFDPSLPADSAALVTAQHYRQLLLRQAAEGINASFATTLTDPGDLSALTQVWTSSVTALVNWWLHNPDQNAQDMVERSARILAALSR